jgi:hypothetical protein
LIQYREGYRTGRLWVLLVPLAAYLGWMTWTATVTGVARVDGALGVLLGLYAGAHPAANGIDLIFSSRRGRWKNAGPVNSAVWLLLNALVLTASLFAVIIGAAQFSATSG